MINLITIISFLFDGIISKYIKLNSYFIPLLTIVSLIFIYPLFKDKSRYFKYIAIIGILYDIVYTNYLFLNLFNFLIIGVIIKFINKIWQNNLITSIISTILALIVYRFLNYIFLILIVKNIPIISLYNNIIHSLILNLLYALLLYFLTFKLKKY